MELRFRNKNFIYQVSRIKNKKRKTNIKIAYNRYSNII